MTQPMKPQEVLSEAAEAIRRVNGGEITTGQAQAIAALLREVRGIYNIAIQIARLNGKPVDLPALTGGQLAATRPLQLARSLTCAT